MLGVFRAGPSDEAIEPALLVPPLARHSGDWRVRMARCVGKIRAHTLDSAPLLEAYQQGGAVFSGEELAVSGLPVPTMDPESALVFILKRLPVEGAVDQA